MPTGYTHAVQSGEMTELADFAWTCARGMMALVSMRDDPADAKIPERFEPDTKYYDERLVALWAELAEITALSAREAGERSVAENDAARTRDETRLAEKDVERARYAAMIKKVEAWETEADGLREFMLDQLYKSIDFDCRDGGYREALDEPLKGDDWRAKKIEALSRSIGNAEEQRARTIAATESRNRWLAALRASLAPKVEAA